MQTQAIGSGPAGLLSRPTTKGFNNLSSEDFFGLLIAQLQAQDPLKPTDNQQLLNQMSSIRQMEQSSALTRTLTALAGDQKFGATAGMIGKYVFGTVTDSGGRPTEISGVVVGVRFSRDGRAILDLHNGRSLPSDKIEEVTLLDNLPHEVRDAVLAEVAGAGEDTGGAGTDGAAAARPRSTDAAGRPAPWTPPAGSIPAGRDRIATVLSALLG
jgi:flagellar basal-body rod modification protein FlgD